MSEPKKESGAQGRQRRAREGKMNLARFDKKTRAAIEKLGPPPMGDPHALTCWQLDLTGVVGQAFSDATLGPTQVMRLKGMLESVRTGGMVAVKAQERKLQRDVAKRMGLVKERDDGLEPFPEDKPKRDP